MARARASILGGGGGGKGGKNGDSWTPHDFSFRYREERERRPIFSTGFRPSTCPKEGGRKEKEAACRRRGSPCGQEKKGGKEDSPSED